MTGTTRRTVLTAAAAAGITAATAGAAHATDGRSRTPARELFGRLADGTAVHRWTLSNGGTTLRVLSYGGIIQSLETPTAGAGRPTSPWASTTSTTTSPNRPTSAD